MEGRLFACRWKKEGKGYRVWVKKRPKLSAKGKTFTQADHRLWTVITGTTGDGESIREYDPPEPVPDTEFVEARPIDMSAWIERLQKSRRQRSKREPLDTNAKIERRFAQRVREHFVFLRDLGLKGPKFSRKYDPTTGMTFRARFASKRRTLDISIDKAYKDHPNGAAFIINPIPVVDQLEWFMSTMYIGLRHNVLGNLLAELEVKHTLDEIMDLQFPLFADLFRSELRPLLTAEQWHSEYEFYRE